MTTPDWDSDFRRMQAELQLTIRDLALQQMKLEHEALEQMVEKMLVSPERVGIAVVLTDITDFDTFKHEHTRQYRLDPNVPFGHIYEFPSLESYELWQERGCPR